jgi:group I intron endonuclease
VTGSKRRLYNKIKINLSSKIYIYFMLLSYIEETLIVILPLLGSIAFMTLAERKVMGLHKIKSPQQLRHYSTTRRPYNKIPSFIYDELTGCIKSSSILNTPLYNLDLSHTSIIPIKIFTNACIFKNDIIYQYKNVCGIYLWFNRVNKKMYVGSGSNLSRRLAEYYFLSKLTRTNKFNQLSPINAAILKYGHDNFSLIILEICGDSKSIDKNNYLKREQYYLNQLKAEYNILNLTDSSLGYKHLEETKNKISKSLLGYKHTKDTKLRMSYSHKGFKHSIESQLKMSVNRGTPIYVFYSHSLILYKIFNSSNKAALYFNCSDTTIMKYARSNKIYKDKWILSLKNTALAEG